MIKPVFRSLLAPLEEFRQSFLEATNWGMLQTIDLYAMLIGLALLGFAFAGGSLCDLFHVASSNSIILLPLEGMVIIGITLVWFCLPMLCITCTFGLCINILWAYVPWFMVGISILMMRILHRLFPNRFDDPLDNL